MYQLTPNPEMIIRLSDRAYVPADPFNVDYQAYQQWLKEGNEPEEAEE